MHVTHLSLTDFRGYAELELPLPPGPSALLGPNGQGKTNVIEALHYIAALSSHRVASDAPLVRRGADRAVLRAAVDRHDRSGLVEIELNPGKANRARLNRAPVPRPREVLGALRVVLFAPEDLALVRGDPGERRRFLDELLVARAPRLAAVRADYERVLKQRNALLKSVGRGGGSGAGRGGGSGADLGTLDVWDAHLARHGAELLAARLDLVEALRPVLDKAYAAVSAGAGPADCSYRSSWDADFATMPDREQLMAGLLEELSRRRSQEMERGVSLVGPHRDDLVLSVGEFPARGYASHGESWSLALALRLASYDLLRADGGEPVLLLDDVFAELDSRRRQRLADLVAPAEQVLVTAAVAEDVPVELRESRYDVTAGAVLRG